MSPSKALRQAVRPVTYSAFLSAAGSLIWWSNCWLMGQKSSRIDLSSLTFSAA
jgi:hypothetical protein